MTGALVLCSRKPRASNLTIVDNMKKVSILLAALLMAPSVALAQNQAAPLVRLAEAEVILMAPTMQVAGTVISRSDAYLSAEVEGRLQQVADVGTTVETGDVLARIEDTTLRLRARELSAEVNRAEASLSFLENELGRLNTLLERDLASTTQIEQTRSERDVAAADLEVARSRLEQTSDQLQRTQIRAPFSGVVAERLAQVGERVSVGDNVLRLLDQETLEVVARAPLDYYGYVRPGDSLAMVAGSREIEGTLRTVVSVGSEASHVFELRLDVTAPLPVGQTVRVTIPMADVREVLAVPRDALVLRGDGTSIFIIDDDNKARRIRVMTGVGSGDMVEVQGPIQPGDKVVIRGNERLRAGQDVQVLEG